MLYLNSGLTEILIKCTDQIGAPQEKSKAFKYQEVKSKNILFFSVKRSLKAMVN